MTPSTRRRARRGAALPLLLVLALGSSTACSASGAGSDGGESDTDAAVDTADTADTADTDTTAPGGSPSAEAVFPLDTIGIDDADQALLEEARDAVVTSCMARHGLEYAAADRPPRPSVHRHTHLYGVDDPVHAAEHGYLHPIDLDPHTYAPVHAEELTPEQELALYGDPAVDPLDLPDTLEEARERPGPEVGGVPVPATGCHGEATLLINRPDDRWIDPTFLMELADEAGHEADADERVRDLLADWSACMADRGRPADSPLTVTEELGLAGDVSGEEAIAVALLDVACKEETDLVARWVAVDAEHQEHVIAEHTDLLAEYAEQHVERMERARAILADGPSAVDGA
ncbi:hypothetical protein [Streptomyces sp. ST2-7A]|uniref:hypothetical protein n=1 Tax=Streptomyces sp. ST2-7A TaxID=2907214 RepID=UPI001F436009|nr:hypothetical protein [Streptomyces sp. ST2-7A]MCE7081847.1 hypothetical protein [Streptomyces sp. ST2-7A]